MSITYKMTSDLVNSKDSLIATSKLIRASRSTFDSFTVNLYDTGVSEVLQLRLLRDELRILLKGRGRTSNVIKILESLDTSLQHDRRIFVVICAIHSWVLKFRTPSSEVITNQDGQSDEAL
jgi:hypothetical protein